MAQATRRSITNLKSFEHNKLAPLPVIHKLKVNNIRQGFFEREMFDRVRKLLPPQYQLAVTVDETYGWRTQSEVLKLEWRQVDLQQGTLRLDPGTTKNDDGRVVYLTSELKTMFAAQREVVRTLERRLGHAIPYVFVHVGKHHEGKRIQDFKKAWKTACRKAGCPGKRRHDFQRTAVRNMERTGVARSVAMKITGHRSESVYRRYAIVSDADLQDAVKN
jgi:integrase